MQTQQQIGIEPQFMLTKKYQEISNESKRRNTLVRNYLELIEHIFKAYKQYYEETQQPIKMRNHQKSIYIAEFKIFLKKFGQIIKETSELQIGCITEVQMSYQDIVTEPTLEIIDKVKTYSAPQKAFKQRLQKVNELHNELINQYVSFKNQSNDPLIYFNPKYMNAKAKNIRNMIQEIQNSQENIHKSKLQISTNAVNFQQYLIRFRKKLVQNKYYALNQMIDYSKHFRNSLLQIMLFLDQCIRNKMQVFLELKRNPKQDTISITQSKNKKRMQDKQLISNIVNSVQEYNQTIDELDMIFKGLDQALRHLLNKVNIVMETQKKPLMEYINTLYDLQESPSMQVLQTLELFSNFTNKFASMSDKIYEGSKKLHILKNNVKKHVDVTLSILRMNSLGGSMGSPSHSHRDHKSTQVQQLYQQISYDYLTDIFHGVYNCFKNVMTDIKTEFTQKYYKKRKPKLDNSMQLSHFEDTVFIPRKKPCKKQAWLWKNWMDKANFTYNQSEKLYQEINKYLSKIEEPKQSLELQKLHCTLQAKKDIKGVLKVCQKYLQFISLGSSNIELFIPYTQINGVEPRVKFIQKLLVVKTLQGQIFFTKFQDIQNSRIIIQQKIQGYVPQGQIAKKKTVQLTPQQIQFLQKRKQQIPNIRPKIQGMIKIHEIYVPNVTVDQVYQYIYSDKPFTIRGKQQDSFFAYVMKKSNNINYVTSTYDTPGPQFYTGIQNIKFTNCPLTSSRTIEFDHPLPPMPFMPKYCHCKQNNKTYWLSNEEFDYEIESQSSGAPYADTFIVNIIHKIYKKGQGITVQIHGALNFVKQTSMKGMLKSKGQKQMIDGGRFTIQEMQKTLKIVSGAQNKEDMIQDDKENQGKLNNMNKKGSTEMDKLKNQNKILIGCLVCVVLLNIIFRMVFS